MENQDNQLITPTLRFVDEGENAVKVIVIRGGITYERELFVFTEKQIEELEDLKKKSENEILEPA